MRVGVRRLRSALRLFEEAIPCPADLQEELRWLGGELGAARDWDVLSHSTLGRAGQTPDAEARLAKLRNAAASVAQNKLDEAVQALRSKRYSELLLRFYSWVEGMHWQDELQQRRIQALSEPLSGFAHSAIRRGHKRLRRHARNLYDGEAAALHRLRIAAKRNRYAVEFFASLYRPKRVRKYITALTALQDELGSRNDISVAEGLLQQLESQQPEVAGDISYVRGYLAAQLQGNDSRLRKTWKKFRKTKMPFKQ
jgi:CHAD domain-containing protein